MRSFAIELRAMLMRVLESGLNAPRIIKTIVEHRSFRNRCFAFLSVCFGNLLISTPHSLNVEECCRRSEECKRYAAETKDPLEQMTLERIAREWHGLAEYKAQTKTA